MIDNVTVEQFVSLVWEGYLFYTEVPSDVDEEHILEYGWDKGWLEEQDILWKNRSIERRNAARIVHDFLRIQCGEADESDWKEAERLSDLYHCKVCAKHVAQVYLKGIMPSKEENQFQLLLKVGESEAREIVYRMFNKADRSTHIF